jgi:predicted CoA-binding protein
MKKTIQAFLDNKKLAIVGASPNKDNFGRSLMAELSKKEYQITPVNPKYDKVEGVETVATVKDLPVELENIIIATPPLLTNEIAGQIIGTHIKRVWMIRGVGKGSATEEARKILLDNGIEVVYGFCPMMFMGDGMHKFHFWLRSRFGKMPAEYLVSEN